MPQTTLECPICKDAELNFEIESQSADDGTWYSAGLTDDRQCECELSDASVEVLEGDAAMKYSESIYAYEPDFGDF